MFFDPHVALLTGQCPKVLESEKELKSGNFRTNFALEKFLFCLYQNVHSDILRLRQMISETPFKTRIDVPRAPYAVYYYTYLTIKSINLLHRCTHLQKMPYTATYSAVSSASSERTHTRSASTSPQVSPPL